MAEYEKQVWQCGDTITADKMNHIEEGIENASSGGAGVTIVHITDNGDDTYSADMTCDEMATVMDGGGMLFAEFYGNYFPLISYSPREASVQSSAPLLRAGRTMFEFNLVTVHTNGVQVESFFFNQDTCDITYTDIQYPDNQSA